jgi:SAM-dependent methyltransferase
VVDERPSPAGRWRDSAIRVRDLSSTHQEPPRFHVDRPTDLRRPTRWHRLAYIIGALPAGLEDLARDLDPVAAGRVLDYGCADQPYRSFFPGAEYLAADLPGNPLASIEIRPDGTVPIEDASVDAVLSTQVLEHVEDPALYLAECFRVLRPGGRMLLSTHGIMVWHPDPVDLWRWTGEGLRRVVEDAGFRVDRFEGIMGLAATGLQLFQDAAYWRLPRPLRPLLALVVQTAVALVDRVEKPESRRANALVFALTATKP